MASQSKSKKGAARQQLRRAAREKLLAAERIRPGSGAYNLACFEAGESNVAEAIKWLKQDAETDRQSTKKQLTEDTDFDPIRNAPAFAEFLRSLPAA